MVDEGFGVPKEYEGVLIAWIIVGFVIGMLFGAILVKSGLDPQKMLLMFLGR